MELSDKVSDIQTKIDEMEKYRYGDFKADIKSIIRSAEAYVNSEHSIGCQENAYSRFQKIEEFFNEHCLHITTACEDEYEPLQVIYTLLPRFKESLDKVFDEDSKEGLSTLNGFAHNMLIQDRLYKAYIEEYQKAIHMQLDKKTPMILDPDVFRPDIIGLDGMTLTAHNDN